MPESYSPSEFIDKVNSQSPNGVKFDPYGTQNLREKLASEFSSESEDNTTPGQRLIVKTQLDLDKQKQAEWKEKYEIPNKIVRELVELKDKQEAIVDGNLDLRSLTSAEGLEFPQSIGGYLYLRGLTLADRNKLRAQRPDLANKIWPKYN